MRNTTTIIILSVVATVLVFGIGACITIKPFSAIGLAPILAAISLIIRAIRGQPTRPHENTKHPNRHSSHTHTAVPTQQPNEKGPPQDPDLRDPINAAPEGIPAPRDLIDIPPPIPNLPITPTDQQQAPDPQHGKRRHWPRPTRPIRHRHRKYR